VEQLEDVEFATFEWVAWYRAAALLERLGCLRRHLPLTIFIPGADDLAMVERDVQRGDAGVEIVREALDNGRHVRPWACTKSSRSSTASGGEAASSQAQARMGDRRPLAVRRFAVKIA
jgi:hypothetical protein